MTVAWDQPIEAVHEDGRVEPASLVPEYEYDRPHRDGTYAVDAHAVGRENTFYADGTCEMSGSPWRIRNVTPTQQDAISGSQDARTAPSDGSGYPDGLKERIEALVRDLADHDRFVEIGSALWPLIVEARMLKPLLPEPVDPDEALARQMVIDEDIERTGKQRQAIADGNAGQRKVALVLAAIRRGRALEKGDI